MRKINEHKALTSFIGTVQDNSNVSIQVTCKWISLMDTVDGVIGTILCLYNSKLHRYCHVKMLPDQ